MRVLMFGCKSPLDVVSAEDGHERKIMRGNSGNMLFSHAAYRTLGAVGTDLSVDDLSELLDRPDWINEHVDHLVLPFANVFRPEYVPQLERFTDLVARLTVPVTVLGIGAQSTADLSLEPLAPLAEPVSRFMRSVLDRSPSVGVRGEFTAHYLRTLGFNDVEVIGCPSMFTHGADLDVRTPAGPLGHASRVAVTAARRDEDWMSSFLTRTHAQHPDLLYVAQGNADMELMLWGEPTTDEVDSGIPEHLTHTWFRDDRVRFFVDVSTWLEHLRGVDFCVGSRIHGAVAALLAGTPAHVLTHDSRTHELADYFEIPRTPAAQVSRETTAAELYARSDYGPLVSGHPERLSRFVSFLDSHHLPHVLGEADGGAPFDQRLASVRFPPPVRALTAEDTRELASRVQWLRREHRRQGRRAQARIQSLENRLAAMEQSLRRSGVALDADSRSQRPRRRKRA